MTDYYKLLEVEQSASAEEIQAAIKKNRRIWNSRSTNPNPDIRAEAEQCIRDIAEAEKILLNDAARAEYNRKLTQKPSNGGSTASPTSGTTSDTDWKEIFFRAYNNDLYNQAAQIAREAINANNRDGSAWFLYGAALRLAGDFSNAIDALMRANVLMPNEEEVLRQLGIAFYYKKNYGEAYKAFKAASGISPNDVEYHCFCASSLRFSGRITEAVSEAKIAYNLDRNDDNARFQYFFALYEDAILAMSYNRSSGKHLITNKVQLDYVKDILRTMAGTIPEGQQKNECKEIMDEITKIAVDGESMKGKGLFSAGKPGYKYNYDISNEDTRASGRH